MACLNPLNVKASEQERAARLNTLVDKWTNHKVIKAMTGGRANEFERFYSEILPNYIAASHFELDSSIL